jgi:hypothetical protein
MRAITFLPKAAWRGIRRLLSLVHGYDDVRETYGDNPNELSEAERLTYRGFGANGVNLQ